MRGISKISIFVAPWIIVVKFVSLFFGEDCICIKLTLVDIVILVNFIKIVEYNVPLVVSLVL